MSRAALETLDAAAKALRASMEEGDTGTITKRLGSVAEAVDAVRAFGAWRSDPEFKDRVADILAHLESDHMLARMLGDMTSQRLSSIACAAPSTAPLVYRRPI